MTTHITPEPIPLKAHRWQEFTLGRICSECNLVQANDEFDDSVRCPGSRRFA